jgi:hypothetical protein
MAVLALVGAAACSDANVAGNYSAQITNRSDGCSLGLTSGQNLTASFTVTQDGSDVSLTVEGLVAGLFLASQVGSSTLTGSVDGNDIDVERKGNVMKTAGNCMYTINAVLKANQDGDNMSGRVEYRAATNGDPDCGTRQGCLTVQDFNASRPPPAAQ